MSEMNTLSGQLDEFVGEPADRRSTVEGIPGQDVDYDRDTGEVMQEPKPQRRTRSDKAKPRSKHVDPFSSGQPIPGEEPVFVPPGVPHVCVAISGVTAEVMRIGIGKTHRNSQQGYAFRGIDDVLNLLPPFLVKHHLVILPHVEERSVTERPARGGGVLIYVTVKMSFDLISTLDGSRERISAFGEAMDSGDKATNKALSTAYKYMAMQTFCIPLIGIDPEQDTYEVAGTQPAAPNGQQQPTTSPVQRYTFRKNEQQSTTPQHEPRGPSPEHIATVLRTAKEKKAAGREEALAWYDELLDEDREILRVAKERRRTRELPP